MEDEERGPRLSKRFADDKGGGEVDYKSKAGTAWSHNFLNQKPWHPLSYPNQRRKWIAEQTHAQRQRRAEEVAREYSQEQEFFRQNALLSKKDKEKVEVMKAVSFMYVRPPGYDPESAKAAEIADEMRKQKTSLGDQQTDGPPSTSVQQVDNDGGAQVGDGKKKKRPRDIYGRPLPTEEEFEVLKNAPKMDTGIQGRAKPFGIEIRNVKCLRCGNFGHQSGDRECPLKDAIMPNEEKRLQRDDPLNAIIAQSDAAEPLKWELKQKPGLSPPRGGYNPDDPNQQIVAEEIFDEYGGFLAGGDIPDLLTNFMEGKHEKRSKRKSKHKKRSHAYFSDNSLSASDSEEKKSKSEKKRHKSKKSKTVKSMKKKRKEHSDSDEDYRSKRKGNFESRDHVKKGKVKKEREYYDPDGELRQKTRGEPSESDEDNKGKHHQARHKSSYSILTGNDRMRSRDKELDSVTNYGEHSKYGKHSKNHKFERRLSEFDEVDKLKLRDRSSSDEDHQREWEIGRGVPNHLHSKSDGSNSKLRSGHLAVDDLIERWHENLSEPDEDDHRSKTIRRQSENRNQHPDSGANIEIKNDYQHYGKDHRAESRHLQDIKHRGLQDGEEHKTKSRHGHPASYKYNVRSRSGREQVEDNVQDKHELLDSDYHRAARRH